MRLTSPQGDVLFIMEANTTLLCEGAETLNTSTQQTTINYAKRENPQTKPPKKKGPWRFIFWLALIVFVASLISLGVILFSYSQGQSTYEEVAKTAAVDIDGKTLEDMTVDWEALLAQNPDTVGWIYIPGTVINYPIVQGSNDERYLTEDFLGGRGAIATFGTIFMSAANSRDFSDPNNIIYGHHMNDGSMFAAIDGMRDNDVFNAHRTVYILTPQGNYRLTSFSLVICGANDPLAQPRFSSDEEYRSYIQDKLNRNVVTPNPQKESVLEMDKIFALVTCDYTIDDGRAVLFASVVESSADNDLSAPRNPDSLVDPEDIVRIDDAAKEIG